MKIPIKVYETIIEATTTEYVSNLALNTSGPVEIVNDRTTLYAVYTIN